MNALKRLVGKVDWKDVVRTVAPALATGLGSPLAGMTVKFMADSLLDDTSGVTDKLEQKLSSLVLGGDPETMLKIRQLDTEFKEHLDKIGVDIFRLEVQDTQSARDLFKVNVWPQIILSALFMTGYFVVLYVFVDALFGGRFNGETGVNRELLGVLSLLLGIFTAEIPRIMGFWFGSSFGSKSKENTQAITTQISALSK